MDRIPIRPNSFYRGPRQYLLDGPLAAVAEEPSDSDLDSEERQDLDSFERMVLNNDRGSQARSQAGSLHSLEPPPDLDEEE